MKTICEPVELQAGSAAVPIRCFTGEHLLPDEASRQQLATLSALEGLDEHVTVLPDVHFKQRNPSPTGTVVVSRSLLVPRAVDPGINCGMRMVSTSIPAREFTPGRLDRLFARFMTDVPIEARETSLLGDDDCLRMLGGGLSSVASALEIGPEELGRIENRGSMTPAIEWDPLESTCRHASLSIL